MDSKNRSRLSKYLQHNGITYQQYLASPHWQDVRRRFWASRLHSRCCYACTRANVPLEVHHKTYRRLGNERLHDLCLLCRDCHQATHDLVNNSNGSPSRRGERLYSAARRIRKALGVQMRGYKIVRGPTRRLKNR